MGALKQYQIDVSEAVSREVADVFANAARMENTHMILGQWLVGYGLHYHCSHGSWIVMRSDGMNIGTFTTWEQCLAFLLEQVNGFALVDDNGQVVGVGENDGQ